MISSGDLLSAIRHRLPLALAVAGSIFLAVVVLALVQPRQYTAGSSMLVDLSQQGDPSTTAQGSNAALIDSIIGTQVDVVRSSAVLGEVARQNSIFASPKYGQSGSERMQNATTTLRKNLVIGTDKGSNVIRLSYTAGDPQVAAQILNQIVDVFLAKQVTLRTMPARSSARWYDQRTRDVRGRFEAAQKRLSDFQRANGIVGVDRMDVEADKARNLSTELVRAQAESAEAGSRSGSMADPSVAQSDIVQNLERDVGMQAGKVAEMSKTFGPNHPDMKAASAALSDLRSSLSQARQTQARSLSAASSSATRREAVLRSKLAEQQSRLLSLSGVQDQLNVLQRDVDAARQTYDTVRQRFNEAALQSEISQASATRLDRADAPTLPSKPNLMLWFVAAVILGGMGGLAAATALELLRPRVRTPAGTARALDLDVIVDMTSSGTSSSFWRAPAKQEIMA